LGQTSLDKAGDSFYDLDTIIVENEGKSVSEIFAEKGEEYFRYTEKETLEEIAERHESFILSCGGGRPVSSTISSL